MINSIRNFTPSKELYGRMEKFQQRLRAEEIDGALIVQNADLFYFSGTCQDAHLFIPAQGEPLLMVKKSYDRALQESALNNIIYVRNREDVRRGIKDFLKGKRRVGLEMDVLPATLFLRYKAWLDPVAVVDVSAAIRETRMIKTPYEIERLKESACLSAQMFRETTNILKEGMTEVGLAGRIEGFLREKGHQGALRVRAFNQEAFMGHLVSGWSSAYPSFFNGPTGGTGTNPSFPQSAGFKKIGRNEPVLIDYATVVNGYIIDHTRIFSIGPLSDKLVKAHNTSLDIKRRIIKETRPGTQGMDLFNMARDIAEKAGFIEQFMGYGEGVNFIGHGIGLELDELPVIAKNYKMILQPGMVFALEPKFVFPAEGAVGVEDTFVLNEDGLEQLTGIDDGIHVI
ncbi:MAG: Xaa-Pro peptidase family protein [Desulfotomaculaceae bacterium]|nr:Xaa-Pro peptidase family protein [Desulfotomaculaceae bacterium]